MKVSRRRPTAKNGRDCLICRLTDDEMQVVNEAIWTPELERRTDYRARGARAYAAITGNTALDRKTVTRHADHIEDGLREATPDDPATAREVAVVGNDYESIVDAAAAAGAKAIGKLEQRIDVMEDKDLLGLAKMGVTARTQQRANEVESSRPQIQIQAIFGVSSGIMARLPESEAVTIVSDEELLAEVHQERDRLELAAKRVEPL